MKGAQCDNGAALDGHVLTGSVAGDEQEENPRSSALRPKKHPNWLTCQPGYVHPEDRIITERFGIAAIRTNTAFNLHPGDFPYMLNDKAHLTDPDIRFHLAAKVNCNSCVPERAEESHLAQWSAEIISQVAQAAGEPQISIISPEGERQRREEAEETAICPTPDSQADTNWSQNVSMRFEDDISTFFTDVAFSCRYRSLLI
ncbi:hypothetical protein F2P81_024988 [Scophthalmus maximus]|uniref:Uncharacterized protein n=1 Tax=Scophthalmus maximus TaxID=52904 RepID=A0A6A4RRT1_SCOMX|nr:hypothetical protein F2P81_024988 [Scophthalmus maximus]